MSQLAQDAPKTEFIGSSLCATATSFGACRRVDVRDRSVSWVLRRALTAYLERDHHDEGDAP